MDPATVAAGERSTRGPAPWVFQKVINRPALVVWAAFCDINRRAQIMQSIQTDKTIKATLLSGRMLEVAAAGVPVTVTRALGAGIL